MYSSLQTSVFVEKLLLELAELVCIGRDLLWLQVVPPDQPHIAALGQQVQALLGHQLQRQTVYLVLVAGAQPTGRADESAQQPVGSSDEFDVFLERKVLVVDMWGSVPDDVLVG